MQRVRVYCIMLGRNVMRGWREVAQMTSTDYKKIDRELQEQIAADMREHRENPHACRNEDAIRRNMRKDRQSLWRPAYVRDCEKIIHLPYYNRYTDKTQVFSSYHNDDISRRALHVQLVSRIARNIGRMLRLNCDLIEAMALGHDLGHTPFGHAGEAFLSEILEEEAGLIFNHNIQSGRILESIFMRNVSLQTLDGVICHNGEFEMKEYVPRRDKDFGVFDREMEACSKDRDAVNGLVPMTLEGCVVRISDMIAYIGKDRQDARKSGLIDEDFRFSAKTIGVENAAIINNITVDIIENSYGRDYIMLSDDVYGDLVTAKAENYRHIYHSDRVGHNYETIGIMFREVFEKLLDDLRKKDRDSVVYRHHIDFVEENRKYYYEEGDRTLYEEQPPEAIIMDYMASMTDSYFEALHRRLFPDSRLKLEYVSYFDDLENSHGQKDR